MAEMGLFSNFRAGFAGIWIRFNNSPVKYDTQNRKSKKKQSQEIFPLTGIFSAWRNKID